jgi:hypothetical protein
VIGGPVIGGVDETGGGLVAAHRWFAGPVARPGWAPGEGRTGDARTTAAAGLARAARGRRRALLAHVAREAEDGVDVRVVIGEPAERLMARRGDQ